MFKKSSTLENLNAALGIIATMTLQVSAFAQPSEKIIRVLARNPEFSEQDLIAIAGTKIHLSHQDYVVTEGETLSQIAQKNLGDPVFTVDGSLDKLLKLNPQLASHTLARAPAEMGQAPEVEKTAEPTPAATPIASATPILPIGPDQVIGKFGIKLGASNWVIRAEQKGSTDYANLISKLNKTIEPYFTQVFTPDTSITYFLGITYNQAEENAVITVQNNSPVTHRFGIRADYQFANTWSASATIGSEEELFVEAISTTALRLQEHAIYSALIELRKNIFHTHSQRIDLFVAGGVSLPQETASYKVSMGKRYSLGVETTLDTRFAEILGGLSYDYQNRETALLSQTRREMILNLGLRWNIWGQP